MADSDAGVEIPARAGGSVDLSDHFALIDLELTAENVPLPDRVTRAAIKFVHTFVIAVTSSNGETAENPGAKGDFLLAPWFRIIYRETLRWYRDRYGDALSARDKTATGLVLIFGAPFRLRVPTVVVEPAKPGETVWVRFPGGVLPREEPLEWIEIPPNLTTMAPEARAQVRSSVYQVAGHLRSVRATLMGQPEQQGAFVGFAQGIVTHLEMAAELLFRQQPETIQKAYWEMQMASESALKAFLVRTTGSFRETHDLFHLCDLGLPHGLSLERHLLKRLPRWEDMADLRYAQGVQPSLSNAYEGYLASLEIVDQALMGLGGLRLHDASFEICQAPWTRQD